MKAERERSLKKMYVIYMCSLYGCDISGFPQISRALAGNFLVINFLALKYPRLIQFVSQAKYSWNSLNTFRTLHHCYKCWNESYHIMSQTSCASVFRRKNFILLYSSYTEFLHHDCFHQTHSSCYPSFIYASAHCMLWSMWQKDVDIIPLKQ